MNSTGTIEAVPTLDAMTPGDLPTVRRLMATGFGFSDERTQEYIDHVGVESILVVRLDGAPVGVGALLAATHGFGGSPVPAANIAHVALAPEHRGRALAIPLLDALIARAAAGGAAMVSLFASTRPVYRRCGFELAGWEIRYEADTAALPGGTTCAFEEVDPRDPRIRAAYDTRALGEAGLLGRSSGHWAEVLRRSTHALAAYRCDDAYVIVDASDTTCLDVRDWAANSAGAARGILGFLGQFRSVYPKVRWHGGPSDDLVAAMPDKGWRVAYQEEWLARVLDTRLALESRSYLARDGECTFALDEVSGEATGWQLTVVGGRGACMAADPASAVVRLSAAHFPSLFTGHRSAAQLVRLGHLSGAVEAVRTIDRLFAGPSPWVAEHF